MNKTNFSRLCRAPVKFLPTKEKLHCVYSFLAAIVQMSVNPGAAAAAAAAAHLRARRLFISSHR